MRRAINLVLLVVLTIPILLATVPAQAQTPPPDTDPNIWTSGISYSDDGLVPEEDLLSGPNCEYQDVNYRKVVGPVVTSGVNTFHTPALEFSSSPLKQCVTSNLQGIFGTEYFSPGNDTSNMMRINNSRNGTKFYGVPASNKVIAVNLNSSLAGNYMIPYNDFGVGKIVYTSAGGLNYDIDWRPLEPASAFKYTNSQFVLTNGQEFSTNGKYMVARFDNFFAKINLETLEMTPFFYQSASVNKNTLKMAISNDGRYISSSINGAIRIHDTAGCQVSYSSGNWDKYVQTVVPAGCTDGGNIYPTLLSTSPGFALTNWIKFSPNGSEITVAMKGTLADNSSLIKKVKLSSSQYVSKATGYLAMGDSFSSGEGDTEGGAWYEPGTDEQGNSDTFVGRNLCHLSRRSYPYLMALQLGYISTNTVSPDSDGLFHSVACSGAKMHNITGLFGEKQDDGSGTDFSITDNQYRFDAVSSLNLFQPGATKQINFFSDYLAPNDKVRTGLIPEIITLGIGGNDAGFGQKLVSCLAPGTCEYATSAEKRSDVLIELASEKQNLIRTYRQVKIESPDSRLYVVGYPNFVQAGGGTCGNNVHLDEDERYFVNTTTGYFNEVIKSAAAESGATYVDVENILQGTNLCSGANDENITVNGVTAGNDNSLPDADNWLFRYGLCVVRKCVGNETYHPNPKAHKLYRDRILQATQDLTTANPLPETTTLPVPPDYFGINAKAFVNSLNNYEPTDIQVEQLRELIRDSGDFKQFEVDVDKLLPGTIAEVSIESTPTSLGSYTVNTDGKISALVTIPEGIPGGFHEIHVTGQNKFGQSVEYYQPIQLAVSQDDFDGDGIGNSSDSCPTVQNSNIDVDKDGVDDACDIDALAVVDPPPPPVEPPAQTSFLVKIKFLMKTFLKILISFFHR